MNLLQRGTMLKRVKNLEENIVKLQELRVEIESNKSIGFHDWAMRYGLFESIQIIIDISCHIASKYNLGTSQTYVECIEKLYKYDYINEQLSHDLISAIGLRNMLIHEYIKIDDKKLFDYLELTDDFKKFIEAVKEVL